MNYLIIIEEYNKFKNFFDKFLKRESGIFSRVKDIINESTFIIELKKDKKISYKLHGKYIRKNYDGND